MCGLAGVVQLKGEPVAAATLARMGATIAHRGPDGHGAWVDGPAGLVHRRLAIIDLSDQARQPMTDESGNLVIVYNGEVYNYQALRVELEAAGHRFHSTSDTEVVLCAFKEWGAKAVGRFNGMFAFAVWDRRRREMFLARDRFGVKPLYYCHDGAQLIFASEIKAILAHPAVHRRVNLAALNEYFTFQNVISDQTMFDGIRILRAGHWMRAAVGGGAPTPTQYWDFDFSSQVSDVSHEDAAVELRRLFTQAVTRQLVSDVPVGSYLSGGMDSGSITAVAGRHLGRMATFTVGFDLSSASGLELGFDERPQAESLSNVLKTEHYEMVMHAGDMEHVMPELIWHLEDLRVGQCYPNFYVARLAGKFVKVVLSGVGGDELFGGYPWRYQHGLGCTTPGAYLDKYYGFWQRLVPDTDKTAFFSDDVVRALKGQSTCDAMRSVFRSDMPMETDSDFINACLYFELKTFLHGLLVVEDRMTMAHSLESRVPFLDNDLVDFACKLAPHYKVSERDRRDVDENDLRKGRPDVRPRTGKRILRTAMDKIVPGDVTARAKQGFSAPDASWFRGESIDYVNALLRSPRASIYDYLRHDYVMKMLDEHSSGEHNHRLLIWSLLSFEWWLRRFMN